MESRGRFIGIDVGTRRVGLARSDLLQTSANPAGTFDPGDVFEELDRYFHEGSLLGFVVGWPLSAEGRRTESTRMVERFINKLRGRYPSIPVYRVDERYSSKLALRTLVDAGVPKQRRREKGRVDQTAAALLLQQFLETGTTWSDE